ARYSRRRFILRHTPTPNTYTLSLHDALPIFGDGFQTAGLNGQRPLDTDTGTRVQRHIGRRQVDATGLAVGDRTLSFQRDGVVIRSEEHTSELQSRENLVCRLLLEKKNKHQAY